MTLKIQPPGPQRPYPQPTRSGKIPFSYSKTGLKGETAYWIWGDFATTINTPLILLHGGPGAPHQYLLFISLVWQDYQIPVVMYDQIGCGESTHFRDTKYDENFWTPELFMAELENVKSALGIETFDLLGQSWGGMLAGQYAIERQPRGLRKLVIADSPSDMVKWVEAAHKLRSHLPRDVEETLDRCEREGQTDSPEYVKAVAVYYAKHVCRVDPWPQEVSESLAALDEDSTVYGTMNGPSEFFVTGSLKTWTITEELEKITAKTVPGGLLLMNGLYDEAQDETTRAFFEKPSCKTKWIRYALSSHLPHVEECERFLEDLGGFLQD